ncbi:hypothetical protein SAMN04489796_101170 [Winogradskyella thalassocola]|uniref:Alpha/beta hydrolase family protein n=1 Tax=Winogradskyella thalassocola TaxID=262004 RepID=A0A1G7VX17_9FLAO|nr:hypothetical protein SAMN04489796_101170 [Winogradskyella thalassocola]
MKNKLLVLFIFYCFPHASNAQVVLNANGIGNTYVDINAVLAPGYNVIEVPDCNHTDLMILYTHGKMVPLLKGQNGEFTEA